MAQDRLHELADLDTAAAHARATASGGRTWLVTLFAHGAVCAAVLAGCENSPRPPGTPPDTVPVATFAKSYGDDRFNTALSALATSDGGYAFVGHWGGYDDDLDQRHATVHSDYAVTQHHDVWIVKLDREGNLVWQRNIGERIGSESFPRVPDQVGRRLLQTAPLRRTLDDGFIVAGVERTADNIGDQGRERFAARKYDAHGSLEWEHSYASGAWRDYEFIREFQGDNVLEARDVVAQDVWAAADGTYWVVGSSVASVRSNRNPPFDGDDAFSVQPEGNEAHNAQSTVVLRLDAQGNLLGLHRFTDGQFRAVWQPKDANPAIIRTDAQGRAILVRRLHAVIGGESRPNRSVAIVDRLDAYVRPIDRYVLEVELDDGDYIAPPVDVIQTDDLEASPIPARDGVADDGYLVLFSGTGGPLGARTWLLKLSDALEPTWTYRGGAADRSPDFGVVQACVPAAIVRYACHYVVGGQIGNAPIGILELFNDVGQSVDFRWEHAVNRIDAVAYDADNRRIVALGSSGRAGRRFRTTPDLVPVQGSEATFERPTDEIDYTHFERDGGFIVGRAVYDANAQPVDFLHSSLQPTTEDSEDVVGLVEVAPDSFVLAANTSTFSDVRVPGRDSYAKQVWLLRVTGGEIVWQQLYGADPQRETMVRAIAPTSDGGFVLNVHTRDLSCASPDAPCGYANHPINARLVKFAANGRLEWESAVIDRFTLVRHASASRDSLRAIGAEFLVATGHGKLTRVSATGAIVWQRELGSEPLDDTPRVPLDIRSVDGFDADADGAGDDGYVALGDYGGELEVVMLDTDGDVLWSRVLQTMDGPELSLRADRARIRSTRDGGFVVAADDAGFVQRAVDDGGTRTRAPVGRRNIVVLKLDSTGAVRWYRAYGGAFDEVVGDLDVLDDGGLLIAGGSDSMGARRDAWILRLDPNGRIANGCQAALAAHEYRVPRLPQATDLSSLVLPGGNCTQFGSSLHIELDTLGSHTCSAHFIPAPFNPTLTVRIRNGSLSALVESQPPGINCTAASGSDCSETYPGLTDVLLRAAPAADFVRWEGCPRVVDGNFCEVHMDAARTITAQFLPPQPP